MTRFFAKTVKDLLFPQKSSTKIFDMVLNKEAVAQRCFVKKVFLEISENSQKNTWNRVS